jgi:preprotein translocase subunit YajC
MPTIGIGEVLFLAFPLLLLMVVFYLLMKRGQPRYEQLDRIERKLDEIERRLP